jgi:hypothetical protein
MPNPIKNSIARVWKKSELKTTLKQCKENGFTIVEDGFLKHVIDPIKENTVLTSADMNGMCMVRLDKTYFE